MRRHAKAMSAGSNSGQASRLGSFFRGAFAIRGASGDIGGSGAPAYRGRGAQLIVVLGLAAIAAMALTAPAFAAKTHPYTGTSFGRDGAGGSATFSSLQALAVDQVSGNVYAYDASAGKVYKFDAAGNPVDFSALSGNVIESVGGGAGNGEYEIAIAPAGSPAGTVGDIYVANNSVVKIYAPSGVPLGELTGGETCGVAVNPAGHVFVGVYSSTVREYIPSGNPVTNADQSGENVASLPGICNVAADGLGNVYAANYAGNNLVKLEGLGDPSASTLVAAATVAIDPSNNDVYANRGGSVAQYDATGKLLGGFGSEQLSNSRGIAVNSASAKIYASTGAGEVAVFGPAIVVPGVSVEPITGLAGAKATLHATVNPDNVAVSDCKFEYGPTAAYGTTKPCVGSIPTDGNDHPVSAALSGLSFNTTYHWRIVAANANGISRSDDQTFSTNQPVTTGDASAIAPPTASVEGTLNPEGTLNSSCSFEYGATTSYGSSAPCAESPATIGEGTSPVPVHANLTDLKFGSTYHYRLVATNAEGTARGADRSFETPGAVVEDERAKNVTFTEALLEATINPKGLPTTYHLEYGTDTSYGNSTAEAPIEAEESGQTVSNTITGLTPATVYHYRFVATNSVGVSEGPDRTFTTYAPSPPQTDCPNQAFRLAAGADLPDCRAYEQATPVNKLGGNAQGALYLLKAATDGSAVTYFLSGGGEGGEGGQSLPTFLASRNGGSWASRGVLLPSTLGLTLSFPRAYSEDASRSYQLTSGGTLYVRTIAAATQEKIADGLSQNSYFGGESTDGSKVVFQSQTKLLPEAVEGVENLYVWDRASGEFTLASFLPNGSVASQGAFAGSYAWYQDYSFGDFANYFKLSAAENSYYTQDIHAMANDGSRLVFTTSGDGQIYVRKDPLGPGASTVHVSASQKTNGSGPGGTDPAGPLPAQFMEATPDGEAVFFTSSEELTNDANTGPANEGKDLYRYDVASGDLIDVTPDDDQNGADVVGLLGTSRDGAYAYFAANGVLATGAEPGSCKRSGSSTGYGTCNIYAWHEGSVEFVAPGGAEGEEFTAGRNWLPTSYSGRVLSDKSARVSSDGRTLAFQSDLPLTDSAPGGVNEFYRYNSEEGLNCVSCSPAGISPIGAASMQDINPGFTKPPLPLSPFLVRYMSADGKRIFFETPDKLLPADVNSGPGCHLEQGAYSCQDVYEWEAEGRGSCDGDTQNGGCLYLISNGASGEAAYFADASANGDDVFFFTDQQLVGQDRDELLDVYTAHVGGGLAGQNPPPPNPCSGEACAGAPSAAPAAQSPGSASFSGPGNATAKHHQKKKQKKKHRKSKKQRQGGRAHR